jgi:hypothetical protein
MGDQPGRLIECLVIAVVDTLEKLRLKRDDTLGFRHVDEAVGMSDPTETGSGSGLAGENMN